MRTKKDILANVTKEFKNSKKVANNTLRIEYSDGCIAIRLHDTDVVTEKDNVFTLNSGGWRSVTTKERMNSYSPARVFQKKSIWYIGDNEFFDGIQIDKFGNVLNPKGVIDHDRVKKTLNRIAKYIKLITKDNLPTPNAGDCWYCLMKDKDGVTMGDFSSNTDHLESHLDEGYIPGALLANAMKEAGYRDEQIGFHYSLKIHETFQRSVRKYLKRRLLPELAK